MGKFCLGAKLQHLATQLVMCDVRNYCLFINHSFKASKPGSIKILSFFRLLKYCTLCGKGIWVPVDCSTTSGNKTGTCRRSSARGRKRSRAASCRSTRARSHAAGRWKPRRCCETCRSAHRLGALQIDTGDCLTVDVVRVNMSTSGPRVWVAPGYGAIAARTGAP